MMLERGVLHLERRRGERRSDDDRRDRSPRLQPGELGRLRSMIRAAAAVAREREEHDQVRIEHIEREIDRLLEHVGLEPLPRDDS